MEMLIAELPLALFTTLAPLGAGAFVALAVVLCTETFSPEEYKRLDRFTIAPLAVTIIGFICSFLHLASPLNAANAFAGVGTSPLSNEIVVGIVFVVVAIVYCAAALSGKLNLQARKVAIVVTAVLALVFALFIGMAYMIPTIPSWDNPFVPLQVLGLTLFGGASFGALLIVLVKKPGDGSFAAKKIIYGLAVGGLVIAAIALFAQQSLVAGLTSISHSGVEQVALSMPFFVGFVVCGLISAAILIAATLKKPSKWPLLGSALLGCAGIFCARAVFYLMEIGLAF
jgi:anaerobic dimethyl sulfoxide reductase subunit C (anchor subunit)/Tat-targeted selenate reductase subunit YnfH